MSGQLIKSKTLTVEARLSQIQTRYADFLFIESSEGSSMKAIEYPT